LSPGPSEFTARSLKSWAKALLENADRPYSQREMDWLVEDISDRSRLELLSEPENPLSSSEAALFKSFVRRRLVGEPIQHILGYTEFYGRRFDVSPDVLIPRPETESLVERALDFLKGKTECVVLDIGTGSGCIAITLAVELPGSMVHGIDVSEPALEIARANGIKHSIKHGIDVVWQLADMYEPESIAPDHHQIDLIVSNPPYIPASDMAGLQVEVRKYDPEMALTPGDDHLKPYRSLARLATMRLRVGGALMVEIEERFGAEVSEIFSDGGLEDVQVHEDLAGRDRFVTGINVTRRRI
jgi:release factor glutamine methyltransferase